MDVPRLASLRLPRPVRVVSSRGDGIAWRIWPGASLLLQYIADELPGCLFRRIAVAALAPVLCRRSRGDAANTDMRA